MDKRLERTQSQDLQLQSLHASFVLLQTKMKVEGIFDQGYTTVVLGIVFWGRELSLKQDENEKQDDPVRQGEPLRQDKPAVQR